MLHDLKPFKGLMLHDKKRGASAPKIVGHEIPDDAPAWTEGKPIRHFVLTLTRSTRRRAEDMNLPERALVFFKVERTPKSKPTARTVDDVQAFLTDSMSSRVGRARPYRVRRPASSIHFNITEPTWLLIELDPSINWRYSTAHPAATTKEAVPAGSNADLRHVFHAGGELRATREPTEHDCRFIFFRVCKREENEKQGFNLAVELYQQVANGQYLYEIPIIIDPDVPEIGSEKFP
jgi:hypothetical protein